MAGLRLWRVATLLVIPAAVIVIAGQWWPSVWSAWSGASTLRGNVRMAVSLLNGEAERVTAIETALSSRANTETRGNISVVFGANTPAAARESYWQSLAEEQARLTVPAIGTPHRVVVVAGGVAPVALLAWTRSGRTLPGQWNPCVIVPSPGTTAPSMQDSANASLPPRLGQCALVLAFGPPGTAVEQWTRRSRRRATEAALGRLDFVVDEAGRREISADPADREWYNATWDVTDLTFFGCRDGVTSACRSLLDGRNYAWVRGDLMWWLAQRDAAAFRRFWTTAGDLDAGARAAFGASLSELLGQFLADRIILTKRGPLPPPGAALAVASMLGLSICVSLLVARRRTAA